MKKILLSVLCLLLTVSINYSQGRHQNQGRGHGMNRLAELEKIKLLETLNLDEESSAVFIVRLNRHKDLQQEISGKRQAAIEELAEQVKNGSADDAFCKVKIDQILEYEETLLSERKEFINSLNDIMDQETISKFVVFEHLFRKEVRNELRKRRSSSK